MISGIMFRKKNTKIYVRNILSLISNKSAHSIKIRLTVSTVCVCVYTCSLTVLPCLPFRPCMCIATRNTNRSLFFSPNKGMCQIRVTNCNLFKKQWGFFFSPFCYKKIIVCLKVSVDFHETY